MHTYDEEDVNPPHTIFSITKCVKVEKVQIKLQPFWTCRTFVFSGDEREHTHRERERGERKERRGEKGEKGEKGGI